MNIKRTAAVGFLLIAFIVSSASYLPAQDLSSARVDKILVLKKDRKLMLLSGHQVIRTYRIALGKNPIGPKTYSGDHKTPEGFYVIDSRNAQSHYHRSLHISYPNSGDRARAKKLGKNPGGDIFIHGLPNSQGWIGKAHALYDWTLGCIAVTDEEIDEIWKLAPNGTPVEIRP